MAGIIPTMVNHPTDDPGPADDVGLAAAPIRILVADDEPAIVDLVATALRYEDFDVATAGNGAAVLQTVASFRPDLIVLDVMLPDVSGFEITRRVRLGGSRTPVLFLTARDATDDRVAGLTVGGDDYVTKPFSLAELIARIRAVLRRTNPNRLDRVLRYADLTMDEDLREVMRAGSIISLTRTEYDLLRYLLQNPRRVLSRTQILDHVWRYDFEGQQNVLDTYVSYLRRKLDEKGPPLIRTVRGVGFALRAEGD